MWNIIFAAAVFVTAAIFIWVTINLVVQAVAFIKATVANNPLYKTAKVSLGQYQYLNNVWIMVGLAVIFLIGMHLFKNPIPALVACIMFGVFPSQIIYSRERARREKVLEQFALAMRIFTGEYSATKQINHGLKKVGEKVADPVGKVFRETHSLLILGVNPVKVYKQMAEKLAITHAQVFASLLAQAGQQGGAIVPVLEEITKKVRIAQKMNKDNSAEINGDRYIGLALSFMPLPVFLTLQKTYPETANFLTETPAGRIIVTLSFVAVIAWFLLDRVLTD